MARARPARRRRPRSHARVEAGEDRAGELLVARAEGGGEQLVPGARPELRAGPARRARAPPPASPPAPRRARSAPTPRARARRPSPAGRPPARRARARGSRGRRRRRRRSTSPTSRVAGARAQARGHRPRLAAAAGRQVRAGAGDARGGGDRRARRAPPGRRAGAARGGARCLPRQLTDDAQLGAVLEREAVVRGEVLVDGAPAARPLVVVVEHDPPARHEPRRDPLQARHRRLVPVAVEVGERDGAVEHDRVLEEALDQLDVALRHRDAEPGERRGDLALEVVAVAVVGLAAHAARVAGGDRRVALVDVVAVLLAGRRDHPEDVVDLHRPLGRLRRGHDDGRAAERRARLDHEPLEARALDVEDVGGERAEVGRLEVGQPLLADLRDDLLDAVGHRVRGVRELRLGALELPARRLELAPGLVELGLELRGGPAREPAPRARDRAASFGGHAGRESTRDGGPDPWLPQTSASVKAAAAATEATPRTWFQPVQRRR